MTPVDELVALGAFYGTPVEAMVRQHGAALSRYAEWVLDRAGFAVVTLGEPGALANLASAPAATRFRDASVHWPEAITGIKLDAAGRDEPTLYVRPVCPWNLGCEWLVRALGLDAARLPPARTLYGLGFQGGVVKTYSLSDEGFVSFRLDGEGVRPEHKDYFADVAWGAIDWPDARWARIGTLGQRLGFRTAGHVGRGSGGGAMKIYVERVGAIPTDRSLA